MSGCSVLSVDHYFSPSAETSESNREGFHDHVYFKSGIGDRLTIEKEGISVNVSIYWFDESVISMGPPYLPVVPMFPMNWIFPSNGGYFVTDKMLVDIDIDTSIENRGKLKMSPELFTIIPANYSGPSIAPSDVKRFGKKGGDLYYDIIPTDIDEFSLYIAGIYLDDKLVVFPKIDFNKEKGLVMYMVP